MRAWFRFDAGVEQHGSGFDPSVADRIVSEITRQGGIAAACYENLEDAAACARVIEFAVSRFGRLDALVHNAGLVVFASLEETEPAVWERMVAIGVDAPFSLVLRFRICGDRDMGESSSQRLGEPCGSSTAYPA